MGNQSQKSSDEDDNYWEIIGPVPPKKLVTIRQSTLNKSIFTVIEYKQENQQDGKAPIFNGKYPEAQVKKYHISKKIQELQHKIGGETLFGVKTGQGPIQIGQEGPLNIETLDNRPVLQKKHARKPQILQLD